MDLPKSMECMAPARCLTSWHFGWIPNGWCQTIPLFALVGLEFSCLVETTGWEQAVLVQVSLGLGLAMKSKDSDQVMPLLGLGLRSHHVT